MKNIKSKTINKKDMKQNKYMLGVSLAEILIVVTIFAALGLVVTSSLILTIRGTKKSESLVKVRENINYSLSVIERNLRNANSVTVCATSESTDPNEFKSITYLDQHGNFSTFSCINTGEDNSYIASGSARLSSEGVKITSCSFSCIEPEDTTKSPFVTVEISAADRDSSGILTASVSAETKIQLRN